MLNEEQAVEEFTSLGETVFEQLGTVSETGDAAVLDAMVEAGMSVPAATLPIVPVVVAVVATVAALVGISAFVGRGPEVVGVARSAADPQALSVIDAPPPAEQTTLAEPQRSQPEQPQAQPLPVAGPGDEDAEADGAKDLAAQPRGSAKAPTQASSMTAAELLVAANAASRAGKRAEARKLYAELAREHSESRERQVAHVGLGDLELKAGRANRALKAYGAYLRANPKGNLVEDALAGKARSLDELDRTEDGREVWADLLERFPTSVHASKARRQLE